MAKALTQTGTVGITQSAQRVAKLDILNGSEIIILAIKPSLWYILLVSSRWFIVLLGLSIVVWLSGQMGWLDGQAQLLLGIAFAGIIMRLAFGLLQWQSRVYILTNLRVLRIRGVLRVEMFQCHLLRLKEVTLAACTAERLLGIGTISLASDSSSPMEAHWLNIRHPVQVHRQILEAVKALKG